MPTPQPFSFACTTSTKQRSPWDESPRTAPRTVRLSTIVVFRIQYVSTATKLRRVPRFLLAGRTTSQARASTLREKELGILQLLRSYSNTSAQESGLPHTSPLDTMAENEEKGIVGRARGMSLSLLNATPQLGMWQATATAIAQAPNLTELREPESGGSNIEFNAHGHAIRTAKTDGDGELTLLTTRTKTLGSPVEETLTPDADADVEDGQKKHKHHHHGIHRRQTLQEKHASPQKESWGPTIKHGLKAFWVFFLTPSGFLITIYGLNVVVRTPMLTRGCNNSFVVIQMRQSNPEGTLQRNLIVSSASC